MGDKEPLSDLSITSTIWGECYRKTRYKNEESGEEYREGVAKSRRVDDEREE
ncbi:MAG TPA: hypothetical protein VNN20_15770 [Thermodesulfobacteriota bacterium]|nr:hypothetical protein [Thermodesulfobacteriota bacterium]